jgi:hypothetical protein
VESGVDVLDLIGCYHLPLAYPDFTLCCFYADFLLDFPLLYRDLALCSFLCRCFSPLQRTGMFSSQLYTNKVTVLFGQNYIDFGL